MWYESTAFTVVMTLVSGLFVWANIKDMWMPFEKCSENIDESRAYAEKFGRKAVTIFTILTVGLSVLYVFAANAIGKIPATVMYVLVIMQMCNLMLENMCLAQLMKYNKGHYVFDKVQRGVNALVSGWVCIAIVLNINLF